jgi:hypothetical protein
MVNGVSASKRRSHFSQTTRLKIPELIIFLDPEFLADFVTLAGM